MDYKKVIDDYASGEIDPKWQLVFDNDGGYWSYDYGDGEITSDGIDWDCAHDSMADEMINKYGDPDGYRDLVHLARAAGINADWCYVKANLKRFVFSKIFRQSNVIDANRLNRLAVGGQTDEDLKAFNHNVTQKPPVGAVVLCERRADAQRFNNDAIIRLPGDLLSFHETRSGTCRKNGMQGGYAPVIDLKKDARIIIKTNGKCRIDKMDWEYVNGDVCRFIRLDEKERLVVEREADRQILLIKRDRVSDTRYKAVPIEDSEGEFDIKAERQGYIEQYPITLGYAQTGASSQGMTLQRVHVHLSPGTPFALNWLYVVLSRCVSIKNISLNRPIMHSDIRTTMLGREEKTQQYIFEDFP